MIWGDGSVSASRKMLFGVNRRQCSIKFVTVCCTQVSVYVFVEPVWLLALLLVACCLPLDILKSWAVCLAMVVPSGFTMLTVANTKV